MYSPAQDWLHIVLDHLCHLKYQIKRIRFNKSPRQNHLKCTKIQNLPLELSIFTSTLSEEVTFNCEARKTREIAPTTTTITRKIGSISDARSRRRNTFKIKKFFYQRRIVTLITPLLASREVAREIFGAQCSKEILICWKSKLKTLLSDNTRTLLFLEVTGETLELQVFACSIFCLDGPPCSLPDCLNGVKSER